MVQIADLGGMTTSFHTYPEYEADVRAAFDGLAAAHGLDYLGGPLRKYGNAHLQLSFGIELQIPQPYVNLVGVQMLTAAMFCEVANLPSVSVQGKWETGRHYAQAFLTAWAQTLAPFLPDLAKGDGPKFKLLSQAVLDYEYKLRTYVFNNAPVAHPARTGLRKEGWKERAEAYLKESGGKLD